MARQVTMRPSEAWIEGFRSIESADLRIGGLQVLLGPNNCGKSNILQSLEFFFTNTLQITASDFFTSESRKVASSKIAVTVSFIELTPEEQTQFRKYLLSNNSIRVTKQVTMQDGVVGTAAYHGVRLTPTNPVYRLDSYTAKPTENFQKLEADLGEPLGQFRPSGRASDELFRQTLDNLVESKRAILAFHEELEGTEFMGWPNVGASRLGHFLSLPAIPDPEAEASLKKSSTLKQLLEVVFTEISGSSPAFISAAESVREAFSVFNRAKGDGSVNADRPPQLAKLEEELGNQLGAWNVDVELEVPVPEFDSDFLRPVVLLDDGHQSTLELKGHGLQRSFLVALLYAWKEHIRVSGASGGTGKKPIILAIEEPELFLHPQRQRSLFTILKQLAQSPNHVVFLVSHSPNFIDLGEPTRIVRVFKTQERATTIVQPPADLFTGDSLAARKKRFNMSQWVNPARGELFFADTVVLVEGPTETAIIPFVGVQSGVFKDNVSVIDCGSKYNIPYFIELLRAFDIRFKVIHDEDPVPSGLAGEKLRAYEATFALNETIARLVASADQVKMVPGEFERLVGVTGGDVDRLGKPLACLEHIQEGTVPSGLDEIVKWTYQ
jgi:putative ATP-dependent endonuclease of the OLD family